MDNKIFDVRRNLPYTVQEPKTAQAAVLFHKGNINPLIKTSHTARTKEIFQTTCMQLKINEAKHSTRV